MKDRELLIRAVRWARLPGYGHTVPEALKKFGLTQSEWRKAQRELGWEARLATDEEILLAGLHGGTPVSVGSLIYYYGWVNHAGLTPAEVRKILAPLIRRKMVRKNGDRYQLIVEWP